MPEGSTKKPGNARRQGRWSQAEIEKLTRSFGVRPDAQIARELGRTVESVRRMARRIFSASEPRTGPWTAREVQDFKRYLGAAPLETIALILRRSVAEAQRKLRELQSQVVTGPWTAADVQTLKRLYGTRSGRDLSVILARPEREVEAKAAELCLAKDKAFRHRQEGEERIRMPRWTRPEIERLRQLYSERPNLEIARDLGRSVKSVVSKAHDLGLHKSEARLRVMGRENVRLRQRPLQPEAREESS